MINYIKPSRNEPLRTGECYANARAFIKNELNITNATIEEVFKDTSKVVYRMKNCPDVLVVVYRKISKISFI